RVGLADCLPRVHQQADQDGDDGDDDEQFDQRKRRPSPVTTTHTVLLRLRSEKKSCESYKPAETAYAARGGFANNFRFWQPRQWRGIREAVAPTRVVEKEGPALGAAQERKKLVPPQPPRRRAAARAANTGHFRRQAAAGRP